MPELVGIVAVFAVIGLWMVGCALLIHARGVWKMGAALDRLTAEVGELTAAVDAGVEAIIEAVAVLKEKAGEDEALNALADRLDEAGNRLSTASTNVTPVQDAVQEEIDADDNDLNDVPLEDETAPTDAPTDDGESA